MDMESRRNCVICGDDVEEAKPLLGDEANEAVAKFRSAFTLFCTLMSGKELKHESEKIVNSVIGRFQSNDGGESEVVLITIPCCMQCNIGLNDIVKIQESIEELKATQTTNLEVLKSSLLNHTRREDPPSHWRGLLLLLLGQMVSHNPAQFRPNLCSQKRTAATPSSQGQCSKRPRSHIPYSLRPITPEQIIDTDESTSTAHLSNSEVAAVRPVNASTKNYQDYDLEEQLPSPCPSPASLVSNEDQVANYTKLTRPCSIVLTRLPQSTRFDADILHDVKEHEDPADKQGSKTRKATGIKGRNPRQIHRPGRKRNIQTKTTRRRRQVSPSRMDSEVTVDPSNISASGRPRRSSSKKSVPVCKLFDELDQICEENDANYNPQDSGDDSDLSMNESRNSKGISNNHLVLKKGFRNKMFWEITPEILLCRFNTVKVSHNGSRLTCQDAGCSFSAAVTDNDYQTMFQKMANHIDIHTAIKECFANRSLTTVVCPVPGCDKSFLGSMRRTYRTHILKEHCIDKVVCEICWQPVRHYKDFYLCHKWNHKNSEEKLGNGLPTGINLLAIKKDDLQKEMEQIGFEGPWVDSPQIHEIKARRPRPRIKTLKSFCPRSDTICEENDADYTPRDSGDDSDLSMNEKRNSKEVSNTDSVLKKGFRNKMFWEITPEILLCRFNTVKVSHNGCRLTCQEAGCSFFAAVTDNDYQTMFQKMANHIDIHTSIKECFANRSLTTVVCPVPGCDKSYSGSLRRTYRTHILKEHCIDKVVCEICWQPVRHYKDSYLCHKWNHKNSEEKLASGLPTGIKLLAIKKDDLQKEMEQIGFEGPWVDSPQIHEIKARRPRPRIQTLKSSCPRSDSIYQLPKGGLHLYKSTFLRFLPDQTAECLEPGCGAKLTAPTLDGLSQVKEHVNECHIINQTKSKELYLKYVTQSRKCLLCTEDSEEFENGLVLRRHLFNGIVLKGVHGLSYHRCEICGQLWRTRESLDKHKWTHKSQQEKDSSGPPVVVNRKVESGDFTCKECGRDFNNTRNLSAHIITHQAREKRRRWLCSQCPVEVLSNYTLQKHIERCHNNELKYKYCPICNQKFFYRDGTNFKHHVKTHTSKEKPLTCDQCGIGFWFPWGLKKHISRVHTDAPKYQCEFCDTQPYKHPGGLIRHQRKNHPDKVKPTSTDEKFINPSYRPDFIGPKIAFPCEICEKVFPLRSRMKKHVKLHHTNELEQGLVKL